MTSKCVSSFFFIHHGVYSILICSSDEAINTLLNDRKLQSMASAKPIVNKVAATMMLEMLNRITRNLPFDELFA